MSESVAVEKRSKGAENPGLLCELELAEMSPAPVRWLWPGRIPLGKVTVVCGEAGVGKSCLALDLAARVSAGAGWPDGSEGVAAGRVMLLNGEDHWGDFVRPRLVSGGANLENITAISGISTDGNGAGQRLIDLVRDCSELWRRVKSLGDVRLVIIDSLEAFLGPDGEKNGTRLRRLLRSLEKLADECGVAMLVVLPGAQCRLPVKQMWRVDRDMVDPEMKIWVPLQLGCGPLPGALGYRILGQGIVWDERSLSIPIPLSRVSSMTARQERNWRMSKVATWLRGYLTGGPRAAREVLEAGQAWGWSPGQINRAKLALGVGCHKEQGRNGSWMWEILMGSNWEQLSVVGSQLSVAEDADGVRDLGIQKNKDLEDIEDIAKPDAALQLSAVRGVDGSN